MIVKKFHVSTTTSPEGVVYTYEQETKTLIGIEIKQMMPQERVLKVFETLIFREEDFIRHWSSHSSVTVVEIVENITFDLFWKKYDDASRSSKKRSKRLWDKLTTEDHIKAYYFYDTYVKFKGNAEKKYCETYLSAEMWNN